MKTYSHIFTCSLFLTLMGCSPTEEEPNFVRYQIQEGSGSSGLNWHDSENYTNLKKGILPPLIDPLSYGLGQGEWYQIYTIVFPNSSTEVTYFFKTEDNTFLISRKSFAALSIIEDVNGIVIAKITTK